MPHSQHPAYSARHYYRGERARRYDKERTSTLLKRLKWHLEIRAVARALAWVAQGSTVIDLPAGTGRLGPTLLGRGCRVVSADISLDMLRLIQGNSAGTDSRNMLACDAENVCLASQSVDYVLSTRFFNLLPEPAMQNVLREMARVVRKGVLIQVRLSGRRFQLWNFALKLRRATRFRSNPNCDTMQPYPTEEAFRRLVEGTGGRIISEHGVISPFDSQRMFCIDYERA